MFTVDVKQQHNNNLVWDLSFAGALESDYPVDEDILNADSYPQYPEHDVTASTSSTSEDSGIGGISFVHCATGEHVSGGSNPASGPNSPPKSRGRGNIGSCFVCHNEQIWEIKNNCRSQ